MFTPELLRRLFSYDPETGIVTRLSTLQPCGLEVKKGSPYIRLHDKRLNARRTVIALYLGEWPEPHAYKFECDDPKDLRWKNVVHRVEGEQRKCRDCGEFKHQDWFQQKPRSSGGFVYSSYCSPCQKVRNYAQHHKQQLRIKYNITPEQYAQQMENQGGGCDICGSPPGERRLCVDHCHETGKVRALLCITCNTGLGAFKDSPKLLLVAAKYILRHKE
jgi:hypothetical protein